VSGFVVGAVVGALAATTRVRRLMQRVPQWAAGAGAMGILVIAWTFALMS
jgi:hypothetical protein